MRARAIVTSCLLLVACKGESVHFQGFADAPSGSPDASSDGGVQPSGKAIRAFDGAVNTALHVGNAWFVGGSFTRASPYGTPRIAHLDSNGMPSGCLGAFDSDVFAIARDGSSLYVGGDFTHYQGAPANYIAKIDVATCALDATFSPPAANGFDGDVVALVVANGALYVGGTFTNYRGVANAANGLAKLDLASGAIDTTFSPAGTTSNGFNNAAVHALAASSSALYVGGAFSAYRGVTGSANNIVKLDLASGALDTTFSPASSNGFDTQVYALAIAGSSLYVGGAFSMYRGQSVPAGIAKVDLTTGAIDTSFSPQGTPGLNGGVLALAASATSLYAGGTFTQYQNLHSANHLAKLDLATGAIDTSFSPAATNANGFDQPVLALAIAGTSLYVGGSFSSYRGGTAGSLNKIAKLDLDSGALDTTFVPTDSDTSGFDKDVKVLATDGTTVWVGGSFHVYAGNRIGALVKLDDTTLALDTTFTPPGAASNGFAGRVVALTTAGSSLYVAGLFSSYRGVPYSANCLAKLDLTTGAIDTTFSPPGQGANGIGCTSSGSPVRALAASASALYVGGGFVVYRTSESANYLAKLDLATGELDTTFSPPGTTANGFDSTVFALALSGNSLYVGGTFTKYKGTAPAVRIAKLDATTGTLDTGFSPSSGNGFDDGYVATLALTNNAVYAGGGFSGYRGAPVPFLAKLDPATGVLDTAFSSGPAANGFSADVVTLAASSTAIYAGGGFQLYQGAPANRIAKVDPANGMLDTTFDPPSSNGFDYIVDGIALGGNALYVGGTFTSYRDTTLAVNAALLDATTGAPR